MAHDSADVEGLIDAGLAHQQVGRLTEAETQYRAALDIAPSHPDALHLLGTVQHQQGKHAEAIALIRHAIAHDPNSAEFHHNLAEALRASGELPAAFAEYRASLDLDPSSLASLRGLGVVEQLANHPERAVATWMRVLELAPNDAEAWNNLGVARRSLVEPEAAEEAFRKALALKPDYAEALRNLTRVKADVQDLPGAVEIARGYTETFPSDAQGHLVHAISLNMTGRFDEAVEACRNALRLDPNLAEAHFNLGIAFDGIGEVRGAVLAYSKTAQLEPHRFAPHVNLGLAYMAAGQLDRAAQALSTGATINPNDPDVLFNLAVAYERCGENSLGAETIAKALAQRPDWPAAIGLLGMFHFRLGEHARAIDIFADGLRRFPNRPELWSKISHVHLERGEQREAIESLRKSLAIQASPTVGSTYLFHLNCDSTISPTEVFDEHVRWAERYRDILPRTSEHPNVPDPKRRIRIGYVSPDFRAHSVSFFIWTVLERHDHAAFEVYIYDNVAFPDPVTMKLRKYADTWRRVVGLSNAQSSQMIADDQIDILVDLAGHTGDNLLPVFASKPAPVQVTYLGYANTTGLKEIDYRLTDAYADPPGFSDTIHTEKLVRLPQTFLCYMPFEKAPAISELPALRNGHVTFSSFNAPSKVNEWTIALWSRVLHAVPDAKFIMKGAGLSDEGTRALFSERFVRNGIAPERFRLVGKMINFAEHLDLYGSCDVAVDPFPYHGTTTTCESLWMGVPVLTLAGQSHIARVGVSIMNNVGLPEFVAETDDEFVEKAVRIVADLPRLAELRRTMRERMSASPLMDGATFIRNIEAAYRQMWSTWCGEQKRESIRDTDRAK